MTTEEEKACDNCEFSRSMYQGQECDGCLRVPPVESRSWDKWVKRITERNEFDYVMSKRFPYSCKSCSMNMNMCDHRLNRYKSARISCPYEVSDKAWKEYKSMCDAISFKETRKEHDIETYKKALKIACDEIKSRRKTWSKCPTKSNCKECEREDRACDPYYLIKEALSSNDPD